MGRFRGLDTDEGWIQRKFATIERVLAELASARRMENATIGSGGLTVQGNGGIIVEAGGDLSVNDGGNVYVSGDGAVLVTGTDSYGILGEGALGVGTLSGGTFTTPSVQAQPSGLLCDAGPGLGFAFYGVDVATGAASVASSIGRSFISHATTSDAANVRFNLDGEILRVVSSRRYKEDIEDADVDPAAVLRLKGRTWHDKADKDDEDRRRYVGFIAEELHEQGLTEFVDYDDEGQPQAIQYDRLSVALLAVVQNQEKRLAALEDAVRGDKAKRPRA